MKNRIPVIVAFVLGAVSVLLLGQASAPQSTQRYLPAGQMGGGIFVMDTHTGTVKFMRTGGGGGTSDYGLPFSALQPQGR
jgi:hypothetical protein